MKTFAQLSDTEIQSVANYFKAINWNENPFKMQRSEFPYVVCMTYAFNDDGEVYEMQAKQHSTYMTMDLPFIPASDLNVTDDLKRLSEYEMTHGKVDW